MFLRLLLSLPPSSTTFNLSEDREPFMKGKPPRHCVLQCPFHYLVLLLSRRNAAADGDAFQQWLQRHLYHCPTRSDVNAVACATDMPRGEGGRGWAPFCEAGVGGNAFPGVPPRPSTAPDERSPSWPAWKWSNAHERRASVIFLTFPVPLLILLWAEVSDR